MTYHCADHPSFTSTDKDEACPECGNLLVDEHGQAAAAAPAPAAPVQAVRAASAPAGATPCPHCHKGMLEPGDDFCVVCGKSPNDGAKPAAAAAAPPAVAPAPVRTFPATLKLTGNLNGKTIDFALKQERVTFGRRGDNDLILAQDAISGHHGAFTRASDGSYQVVDLGSSNGTQVAPADGSAFVKVTSTPVTLKVGDKIVLHLNETANLQINVEAVKP
ncbi:MAG TPA: FHA domain-containing protein [Planktothrix sp.]|jgi:hypothetical protein